MAVTATRVTTAKKTKGHAVRKVTPSKTIWNPKFDPRILTHPDFALPGVKNGNVINRGAIIGADNKYGINFLYNPSVYSLSHAIDSSNPIIPQIDRNVADTGSYFGDTGTTLTFDLLFDRTYELWDSSIKGKKPAGIYGTAVDVFAIYQLTGVATNIDWSTATQYDAAVALNKATAAAPITAPIQPNPCTVYFGGVTAQQYYGFISGLAVNHIHFASNMVPMRTTVSISMNILPATTSFTTAPVASPASTGTAWKGGGGGSFANPGKTSGFRAGGA
jgi:hypothetical protein